MTADLILRGTIWLALIAWAAAEVLKRANTDRRAAARSAWTAGALLLAAHTVAAFAFHHDWSHAAALAATAARAEDVTGTAAGWGLYLNYLLLVVWIADAAWWWMRPAAYLGRSRALEGAVFAFFVFMFINGAVIFVAGPLRVVGGAAIAAALAARLVRPAVRLQRGRA